jgi:hypothetical protein
MVQVLNPTPQPVAAAPPQRQSDPSASFSSRQGPPQQSVLGTTHSPHQTHMSQPFNNQGPPPPIQHHERSFSQGQPLQTYNSTPMGSAGGSSKGAAGPGSYNSSSVTSSGPPQLSTLPFQTPQPPSSSFPQQQHQAPSSYGQSPVTTNAGPLPPLKPVFGLSLEQLFERDGSAVPMVVYQCIQAVDLFGLEVEGIYRLSGTASHITKIKAMFDNGRLEISCSILQAKQIQMPQKWIFATRKISSTT